MIDLKAYISGKLNSEQALATLHTATPSLIIAGAGSGKTRVLTYKIAYLFRGLQVPSSRVLAVTFTNKAANEMKERLVEISKELLQAEQEAGLQEGFFAESTKPRFSVLQERDLKRVGTFHAIFLKFLKEDIDQLGMKYTKHFGILDDANSVIKEVLKRLHLTDTFKPKDVQSFISKTKNMGQTPADFLKGSSGNYDATMGKVYEEYQKSLEIQNLLDFDDLLFLPYLLCKKSPATLTKWQQAFDYILVDEAQDTNWIQFELMKLMTAQGAIITMIGDDYQSIYGRRGAMMENFLNLKAYWPAMEIFKLQTNYRSKPHIVEAGNAVIKKNRRQYEKEVKAHREGEDKITLFSHPSDIDEAGNTVELIKKFKQS